MQVQVVTFKSWSDSYGNRTQTNRPGILVALDGKVKLIPIMSNNSDYFERTDSKFDIKSSKFGIKADSWLAFGYEVDWDRTKKNSIVRKSVAISLEELKAKRANYWKHDGVGVGSPY